MLRIRQICLVAEDLDKIEAGMRAVFGLEVCFRDPGVGKFGLHNFLMPIGNSFLETVAPVEENTTGGRYLERRGGDGGYMVIMQCDDIVARRQHVADLGIRLVADMAGEDSDGIQLHPKDVPGAIAELRWNRGDDVDDGPWGPAGPDWKPAKRTERISAIAAAELQSPDPDALAARWSEVLQIPVAPGATGAPALALDGAEIRFVPLEDGRGEGLGGLDLKVEDREAVLQAATEHGSYVSDDQVMICGMRLRLV